VIAGTLAVALLVLLSALIYSRANEGLRDHARQQVRDATTLAAQLVGEQTLRFSEIVQSHAADLAAISDGPVTALNAGQRATIGRELDELVMGTRGLRAAGFQSPAGRLLIANPPAPDFYGKSFAFRDWYRGVTSIRSPYVSRVFRSSAAGAPKTVTVAALVKSMKTGATLGILSVGLERRTQELVTKVSRTQGLGIVVTDQAGDVVALSGVSSDEIVSMRDDPLVRAALAGRSGTMIDDDSIAGYAPVPTTGWTVSARLPTEIALKDVRDLRTLAILLTGVIAIVLAALTAGLVWYQRRAQQLALAQTLRKQAVHLHDGVVQTLTVAQIAREAGDHDAADQAVADALAESKRITSALLPDDIEPGDLVRPDEPPPG
jgi:hypothetical protein